MQNYPGTILLIACLGSVYPIRKTMDKVFMSHLHFLQPCRGSFETIILNHLFDFGLRIDFHMTF